ncbi:MAG TPA: hypothetical protein VJC03_02145, partial [bacterium]|nr:hypothetical protein [bacterium]
LEQTGYSEEAGDYYENIIRSGMKVLNRAKRSRELGSLTFEQFLDRISNELPGSAPAKKTAASALRRIELPTAVGSAFENGSFGSSAISVLEQSSAGFISVYDFIDQARSGGFSEGGYALGLSGDMNRNIYDALTNLSGLTHYRTAYKKSGIALNEPGHLDKFLGRITASGKPVVFFVPGAMFEMRFRDSATTKEMEWLINHPGRLKNVTLVFGAYESISPGYFMKHLSRKPGSRAFMRGGERIKKLAEIFGSYERYLEQPIFKEVPVRPDGAAVKAGKTEGIIETVRITNENIDEYVDQIVRVAESEMPEVSDPSQNEAYLRQQALSPDTVLLAALSDDANGKKHVAGFLLGNPLEKAVPEDAPAADVYKMRELDPERYGKKNTLYMSIGAVSTPYRHKGIMLELKKQFRETARKRGYSYVTGVIRYGVTKKIFGEKAYVTKMLWNMREADDHWEYFVYPLDEKEDFIPLIPVYSSEREKTDRMISDFERIAGVKVTPSGRGETVKIFDRERGIEIGGAYFNLLAETYEARPELALEAFEFSLKKTSKGLDWSREETWKKFASYFWVQFRQLGAERIKYDYKNKLFFWGVYNYQVKMLLSKLMRNFAPGYSKGLSNEVLEMRHKNLVEDVLSIEAGYHQRLLEPAPSLLPERVIRQAEQELHRLFAAIHPSSAYQYNYAAKDAKTLLGSLLVSSEDLLEQLDEIEKKMQPDPEDPVGLSNMEILNAARVFLELRDKPMNMLSEISYVVSVISERTDPEVFFILSQVLDRIRFSEKPESLPAKE